MKVKHLPGLDGLRFISITFVVLHHLFTFKTNFGFNSFDYPVLGLIGLYGIHFFFMGSGFLITYLLLFEFAENGRINLKYFFLRRILRIWPAYYLLIITALLLLLKTPFFRIPGITDNYLNADFQKSNLLYFCFMPHLQPFFFPTAPYIHQTYTIGIEEQFYLLWGLMFYFFRKWMYSIFIVLLFAGPLLNILHYLISETYKTSSPPFYLSYVKSGITYLQYSRFSTFAIGSLVGYAYFQQKNWVGIFKNGFVQVLVYAVLVVSIALRLSIPFFQNEYMAGIMACVMLIGVFKKDSFINYSANWLSHLGKISYGIYLFHMIAIVLAAKAAVVIFSSETGFNVTIFLILTTLVISITFGYLSYYCFETYFLKLKSFFRNIRPAH